jgi:hypothetical protein
MEVSGYFHRRGLAARAVQESCSQKDLLRRSDISTTKNVCGRAPSPDMRKAHNKLLKQLIPDGFQTK